MNVDSLMAILAIGLASNLDNAGVGVAYGVRKIRIPLLSNSMIALMGFLLALGGGVFGNSISLWFTPFMSKVIGMIVLVVIGLWILSQPFLKVKVKSRSSRSLVVRILRNPEDADLDGSKTIGFVEAIILGVALSINNLAGGFDAGITHMNIWAASIISGLFSYLSVGFCAYLGSRFAAEKAGQHSSVFAGILLILIGLHQII